MNDCEILRLPEKEPIIHVYSVVDNPSFKDIKRKENIDLAAWSVGKGGEFFECKLSPNGFIEENAGYLQEIYAYIKEANESVVRVTSFGGITLDTTERLKTTTGRLVQEWFVPVGRDRLFELGEVQLSW